MHRDEVEQRLDPSDVPYVAHVRAAAGRLALREATSGDVRAAIDELGELARIDIDVPVLSRHRSGRLVKQGVKQLGGWYVRYVAQQVTILGLATVRLGDALAQRGDALDAALTESRAELAALRERVERLEAATPRART